MQTQRSYSGKQEEKKKRKRGKTFGNYRDLV
jgi:hypothetical protein